MSKEYPTHEEAIHNATTHLNEKLEIHIDEEVWAGSKTDEGLLKDLITGTDGNGKRLKDEDKEL
jgi:hypothetical protein